MLIRPRAVLFHHCPNIHIYHGSSPGGETLGAMRPVVEKVHCYNALIRCDKSIVVR